MGYTIDNIIKLRDAIEVLDKGKHMDILKILKKHNIEYSANKNGTFVNLSILENNVIGDIQKYMIYLNKQEKMINDVETQKQNYEAQYFT